MSDRRHIGFAALAALAFSAFSVAAVGCGDAAPTYETAPLLDLSHFREEVQPVLSARCGNPTTCHATDTRPLSLYARRAHRLDPADIFRDPPLTDEEVRANYDRARSFAVDRGYGVELLTKPLAESAGGVRHYGEDIFTSTEDREYRALVQWVEDRPPEGDRHAQ